MSAWGGGSLEGLCMLIVIMRGGGGRWRRFVTLGLEIGEGECGSRCFFWYWMVMDVCSVSFFLFAVLGCGLG